MKYKVLNRIDCPSDIQKLNMDELNIAAEEIRNFLIDHISKTGGHLSSNLGTIELTLALHRVFSTPIDKIIWDVGHQSYTHKIITGRKAEFFTLRQFGGISGFPKTQESSHDCFNTGHSSTSISAALGFAKAAEIEGKNYCSVAIIGDGALTGGMAFEALNHVGSCQTPIIIILNDNGMSIVKNVGGLATHFNKMRNNPLYFSLKRDVKTFFKKFAGFGDSLHKVAHYGKKSLKNLLVPSGIFENFGLTYLGPIDGHDISSMITVFEYAKEMSTPVIVHVLTQKGHGYKFAEKNPDVFHGINEFNPKTGHCGDKKASYSMILSEKLCSLAVNNKKIVAITAAMSSSTGLTEFSKKFPKRFFDVGIAEAHAVTFAAGLAKSGMTPIFAVYSSFLQRGYDQILHDVCMQNLHVIFAIDRAGLCGFDGETHQGIYDISYLIHMPNISILAPSQYSNFKFAIDFAVNNCHHPIAIRYPRAASLHLVEEKIVCESWQADGFYRVFGCKMKCELLIISVGEMLHTALRVMKILREIDIKVTVIDMITLKPINEKILNAHTTTAKTIAVIEDNIIIGGFGSVVESFIGKKVLKFGLPEQPVPHGAIEKLREIYGLNAESIAQKILKLIKLQRKQLNNVNYEIQKCQS